MDFRSRFSRRIVEFLIRYKYAAVSAIVAIGCLCSFFLYTVSVKNLNLELAAEFHTFANSHFETIQDEVHEDLNVLKAIDAFYNSSVFVERDEFESFVSPFLVEQPGIRTLGFAPLVDENEKPDFVKSCRQAIAPTFQIWSLRSKDERSNVDSARQSLPITYLATSAGDSGALGFDLNSDSEIRNTLENSHSKNKIVAGHLPPAFTNLSGSLIITEFLAIVRQNHQIGTPRNQSHPLIGYTFGIFEIDKLLLERSRQLSREGVNLDIYEITDEDKIDLLYAFHNNNTLAGSLTGPDLKLGEGLAFNQIDTLDLSGRKWLFAYTPSPKFAVAHNQLKSVFVLVGGILAGTILSLVVLMILNQMERLREFSQALASTHKLLEEDTVKRQQVESALRESKRSIIILIGNLPGVVYRRKIDRNWSMEYVSDGCKETTGYDGEELISSKSVAFSDLILAEERNAIAEQARKDLNENNSFLLVYRIKSKDGRIKWLWDRGQGVQDEKGVLMAVEGYISDITKQKEAELRLQDAARLKSIGEAAATIIHDFKNPMQIILSSVEILKSKAVELSTNIKYCDKIEKQVHRIQSMSQEILDYSRDELVLHPSLTNFRELVLDIVDTNAASYARSGVSLALLERTKADALFDFNLDKERIWRVIMNLVNNAKEAMPSGGKIELELMVSADEAEFSIKDNGPGIPEEIRETLFEPFVTKGKTNGTGLGLTIAKRIIEAHKGKISFVTQTGGGTTFFVTLPRSFNREKTLPHYLETSKLSVALNQPLI
jgi:PAS domain S-box-containing protein